MEIYNAGQNTWNKVKKQSSRTGLEQKTGLDNCSCIIFDRHYRSLISGKYTGYWALSPPSFDLSLIFSNFVKVI